MQRCRIFDKFKVSSNKKSKDSACKEQQYLCLRNLCKLEFQHLVNKHQSDKASKGFSSWSQFIAMLFCQLTGAETLREISDGLFSSLGKLNHIGAKAACRSTLSYANQNRPYKLYEDFYY